MAKMEFTAGFVVGKRAKNDAVGAGFDVGQRIARKSWRWYPHQL
jgi:hypothetical protein